MAIVSVIVGGILGFLTFLFSVTILDYSFLQALALYVFAGLTASTAMIVAGAIMQRLSTPRWNEPAEIPAQIQPEAKASTVY